MRVLVEKMFLVRFYWFVYSYWSSDRNLWINFWDYWASQDDSCVSKSYNNIMLPQCWH